MNIKQFNKDLAYGLINQSTEHRGGILGGLYQNVRSWQDALKAEKKKLQKAGPTVTPTTPPYCSGPANGSRIKTGPTFGYLFLTLCTNSAQMAP